MGPDWVGGVLVLFFINKKPPMDDAAFGQMMRVMGQGYQQKYETLQEEHNKLQRDFQEYKVKMNQIVEALSIENRKLKEPPIKTENKSNGKRGPGRPRKEVKIRDVVEDEDEEEEDSEEDAEETTNTPRKRTRSTTLEEQQSEDDDNDHQHVDDSEVVEIGLTVRPEDFFSDYKVPTEDARNVRPRANKFKKRADLHWDFFVNNNVIQPRTLQNKPTPLFCRFTTGFTEPQNLVMWLQQGEQREWKLGSWMDKRVGDPKQRLDVVMLHQAEQMGVSHIQVKVWEGQAQEPIRDPSRIG
ncbi:nucleolar transcription factor 1 isoform 1 [Planoprotostelium fungivorum]|uniref:Nucleolar transcription factor 1 isoform 1 n=1 Tax=Planoprotostelium fungivorum TaxID=1890364 RepID=A0A2P6N578_9EUKA|nr:nucleolar transcription factor 1 isoform 1 [Planoprotostelium fungivorum]